MKQIVKKRIAAILCILTLLFSFAVLSSAGNGDGSGGGKDQPLTLASCSIANGAQDVSRNPQIVLTFSKNVVHFTVRDNNKKCFTLTDSSGANVPINVIMGDDQVDPSIKRIVTVEPKSELTPGMTYLLKIGKDVTSKSGVSLGRDNYISFTVAGEKTTKPTTSKTTTTKQAPTKTTASKPSAAKPAETTTTAATSFEKTTTTTTTETSVTTEASVVQPVDSITSSSTEPSTTTTTAASEAVQTSSASSAVPADAQNNGSGPLLYILIIAIPVAAGLTAFLIIKKKKS